MVLTLKLKRLTEIVGRVLTKFSANKTAVGLTEIECSF